MHLCKLSPQPVFHNCDVSPRLDVHYLKVGFFLFFSLTWNSESGLLLIKAKKSPSWCCIKDFQTQMSSSSTLVQEYFTPRTRKRVAGVRMERIVRKSCFAKCLEFNHLLNLPPKLDNTLEASTAYSNTLYNRLNTD
jgi:hypothetical protein